MIRIAEMSDLESVIQITRDTISEIYSHYYPEGVVDFFLQHHSRENVLSDIENQIVWLLEEEGSLVGTVTIKGNAVNRLFVLPQYQSHGYGSQIMDFAEDKIAEKFNYIHIDSSLAAKEMYLKRGYREKKTCRIQADNGDILIYDEMEKLTTKEEFKMSFTEICIYQVKPQKTEEFETLMLEAKSFLEKQEGLISLRLVKRGYRIDMEQIKEGLPPLEIKRIVKSVKYMLYWEFDTKESYGVAQKNLYDSYWKSIEKCLIVPHDKYLGERLF